MMYRQAATRLATLMPLVITTLIVPSTLAIRILPSESNQRSAASAWDGIDGVNDVDSHQRRLLTDESVSSHAHPRDLKSKGKVPVNVPTNPDDHLVTNLPLLDASEFTTRHWAGLLPASADGNKYFFYWLFAPATDAHNEVEDTETDKSPLLIWLNGGPACSSMDGLWLENGPFRLVEDDTKRRWDIKAHAHSWHTAPAYTLYIDQPVGTGLSFTTGGSGSYPGNDEEVNIDFYYFLTEFMKLHSDKFLDAPDADSSLQTLNRDLFFSGESHAGHYVPSMMNYIRKQNDQLKSTPPADGGIVMPLSGAAIGNGWVHPKYQYSGHGVAYGYGMIGEPQMNYLAKQEINCQHRLDQGDLDNNLCFGLQNRIIHNAVGKGSSYRISSYDMRKFETGHDREFPPGHKIVEAYLGGHSTPAKHVARIPKTLYTSVLAAIHASESRKAGQIYAECTDPPYNALAHQDGLGVTQDVIELLEDDTQDAPINLLFFNGMHDLVCNHVGNEVWMEKLEWKHQHDYVIAARYAWRSKVSQAVSGYYKAYENFALLKLLDSGHMVPMDIPDIAKEMMQIFMHQTGSRSFNTHIQDIQRYEKAPDAACPVCSATDCDESGTSVDEVSCPDCPTCASELAATSDNNNDDAQARPGLEIGSIVIPQSLVWVVLILSLMSTILTCLCARPKTTTSHSRVEMSSGYHDDEDGFS